MRGQAAGQAYRMPCRLTTSQPHLPKCLQLLGLCTFCVSCVPHGVLWACSLREGHPTATAATTLLIAEIVLL